MSAGKWCDLGVHSYRHYASAYVKYRELQDAGSRCRIVQVETVSEDLFVVQVWEASPDKAQVSACNHGAGLACTECFPHVDKETRHGLRTRS